MSSPRHDTSDINKPEVPATTTRVNWWSEFPRQIFIGGFVGAFSSILTFPLDKVMINLQNGDSETLKAAVKNALGGKNALKGLPFGLGCAVTKNMALFPLMQLSQQHIENKFAANFAAAMLGGLILAPMNLAKTKTYGNQSLHSIQKFSDLYRGAFATLLRDSSQLSLYFTLEPIVKAKLKQYCDSENPAIIGAISGSLASVVSQLPATIAVRQKLSDVPLSMVEASKRIYRQGGLKGFYPLFFSTTLIRVGLVQGGAIGLAKDFGTKQYAHMEEALEASNRRQLVKE